VKYMYSYDNASWDFSPTVTGPTIGVAGVLETKQLARGNAAGLGEEKAFSIPACRDMNWLRRRLKLKTKSCRTSLVQY